MQYLLARDGKQIGQFSEEEIRSGLFEGRYLPTDVAWAEGMAQWEPLGELMGQGVTRVAGPRQLPGGSPVSWSAPTHTAGLSIAALVLGILALLTCGLFGLTAIPAIVCGHLALSNIGKSGGTLGGRGMAVTGLVMGYTSVLLVGVAILSSLSMGAIAKMGEKGQVIQGISTARQTVLGVKVYAADKQGKYPATLEELVTGGNLEQQVLDKLQSFKPTGWQGESGFEYRGAAMTDSSEANTVLLISRCQDARGKRVVATNDMLVELKALSSP
jgi:hypothetical protein